MSQNLLTTRVCRLNCVSTGASQARLVLGAELCPPSPSAGALSLQDLII